MTEAWIIDAARARLVAERDRLSAERDASIGRIEGAVICGDGGGTVAGVVGPAPVRR